MNILISNDDGIFSGGIKALSEELSKKHNVYVVAPDRERSAASHSLTLTTPLRVEEMNDLDIGAKKAWAVSGTPGDCVKIGINAILSKNEQPDIVISGINHGPNLGYDVLYSGTVSAAVEAAMLGLPAIALSLVAMKSGYDDFKFASKFASALVDKLNNVIFPNKTILNVNIPNLEEENITGVAITELGGKIFTSDYEKRVDPRGQTYYWMAGVPAYEPQDAPTDLAAIRNNKISITPLCFDMTRKESLADLNNLFCKAGTCNWY